MIFVYHHLHKIEYLMAICYTSGSEIIQRCTPDISSFSKSLRLRNQLNKIYSLSISGKTPNIRCITVLFIRFENPPF